ncbi:MAG TPA: hypothetical protein VNM90_24230 [Haliangium sp.]|nr:hypothetical protein [Haliangium sp.]
MTVDANQNKASDVSAARSSWLQRRVLSGNRLHKWLILLLVAGGLGLYGWHWWSMNQLRDGLAKESAARHTQVQSLIDAQTQSSLRLTAMALSWAASQAMQREELTAMDEHITRMVKVGPVKLIAVLDRDGLVRVSTNKKLEGTPGATALPGAPLTAKEPTVVERGDELVMVAPLDYALGTAVLIYDRPTLPGAPPATPPATAGQPAPAPPR